MAGGNGSADLMRLFSDGLAPHDLPTYPVAVPAQAATIQRLLDVLAPVAPRPLEQTLEELCGVILTARARQILRHNGFLSSGLLCAARLLLNLNDPLVGQVCHQIRPQDDRPILEGGSQRDCDDLDGVLVCPTGIGGHLRMGLGK